jgi:prolyl-tRNA editing enzyme YbaK/EbsC (Cys-tRNA(Pro) deacylase)
MPRQYAIILDNTVNPRIMRRASVSSVVEPLRVIIHTSELLWSSADSMYNLHAYMSKLKLANHLTDGANTRPLGEVLPSRWLDREVVSCRQAADAKNLPLQNELKTLILRTTSGIYAVHLRGDQMLSLRAVKRFLHVKEAHLLSVLELSNIGLTPGTVCPFLPPVWNMPQLLSSKLLDLEFATTNNGTLTGYFIFKPQLLLNVPHVELGDFELPC